MKSGALFFLYHRPLQLFYSYSGQLISLTVDREKKERKKEKRKEESKKERIIERQTDRQTDRQIDRPKLKGK